MKTLFKTHTQQMIPLNAANNLTRSFVETGDERCPLAGIWSRLPELDAAIDDEPGLTRPAWGMLLLRALSGRARDFSVICHS